MGRRDSVVIATKFGMDMQGKLGDDTAGRGSRDYIRRACEASLQRLQTDRIDLYQYHEPDGVTSLAETLGAINELVSEGKVLSIGISNVNPAEIEESDALARQEDWAPIVSVQNEYNLLNRHLEADAMPVCERLGSASCRTSRSPAGCSPANTGAARRLPRGEAVRSRRDRQRPQFEQIEGLAAFAEARGITMLDVAVGTLLAHPTVSSVIAGATSPEQVRTNVHAGRWRPTADDLAEIDRIAPPPRL